MIYAIKADEINRVKLGYCKNKYNLVWRFQSIDTHCPTEVTLMGVQVSGTRKEEKALHAQWAAARCKGEWFRLTPELKRFITKTFCPYEIKAEDRALAQELRGDKGDRRRPGYDKHNRLLLDRPEFVSLDSLSGASDEQGEMLAWSEVIGTPADQEIGVMAAQMVEKIERKVTRKGDELSEIFRLRSEGRTFEQIAKVMGKEEDAVRKAFSRAKKKLSKSA